MKNIAKTLIAGFIVVTLAACSVTSPAMVTSNPSGSKTGVAEYKVLFGFVLDGGNAGIAKAAENGKITKISTVDQYYGGGIFLKRVKTIVTGE